ncbi:hypothetical protein TU85_24155 [Pseudomonas helleri]|uniref:hypothetical protein n=1 Tax=Pseudomonas helleri TaxID=1608996 RepID=UPI000653A36A|nr:hypothetical protein [Pseudomonas helleri]KMN18767.1 hypothetical protein TU85_24155 [Pseudomonas helleri]
MERLLNIDHLSVDELVTLNHHIIERLKMLESLEAHKSMMQFHPGARVSFDSPSGERLSGTVMKFNRKTVTVVTDTSQRWNISPHLLSPIKNVQAGTVVDIKPQKMK